MSVLTGAAAAALYGSNAANGAIVITTKKGKKDVYNLQSARTQSLCAHSEPQNSKTATEQEIIH